jgi:hypothetical protein
VLLPPRALFRTVTVESKKSSNGVPHPVTGDRSRGCVHTVESPINQTRIFFLEGTDATTRKNTQMNTPFSIVNFIAVVVALTGK